MDCIAFAPDRRSLDIFKWGLHNREFLAHDELMNEAGFREAAYGVVAEDESAAAAMSGIISRAQALLDDMYDQ